MSSISSDLTVGAPSSTNAFSALSSEDFVDIMFTELTNQDPLEPNDTQALLGQIDTIRSIESDQAMTDTLETLVKQNEVTAAGSLIGKFVTGISDSGLRTASYVDSVSVTRDGTILNLSTGARVPLSQVDEIIDPELIEQLVDAESDDPDEVGEADEEPSETDEPAESGSGDEPDGAGG